MKKIEHYFWINSDWAYLGADRLAELSKRFGVEVVHKPVDLLEVYARTGGIPLALRSKERQAYREAELRRWTKRLSISLNIKPRYMCPDGSLASRFVIAAEHSGHAVAALYKAVLHAEWCEEQDISAPEVLLRVAEEQGLPGQEIMKRCLLPEVEATYRRYTDEAVALGVFGSPTYVFAGELYWGQDRLDFLEEALAFESR